MSQEMSRPHLQSPTGIIGPLASLPGVVGRSVSSCLSNLGEAVPSVILLGIEKTIGGAVGGVDPSMVDAPGGLDASPLSSAWSFLHPWQYSRVSLGPLRTIVLLLQPWERFRKLMKRKKGRTFHDLIAGGTVDPAIVGH